MQYDFETVVDRRGTGSLKWQKYAGRDILPMWVADMDFVSPPEVLEALHARIAHGVFGYTLAPKETVDATLAYLERVHGIQAEPAWLVWIHGLVPALNVAAAAAGEPGDAVMTCTPVYPPFLSAPPWQARRLVSVPLTITEGRYTFDWAAMEAAVTPQTRTFYLCQPHNPVGRVYAEAEIRQLADFCARHDLTLVSDEIHCDLILDEGVAHVPTLRLGDAIAARTIAMYAPSKTYNLPGLSCAYCVIPDPKLRGRFQQVARGYVTEVNALGYTGCAAAYSHGEPWRQELLSVLRRNRDLLYATLASECPEIGLLPMEATYLAWLDVRAWAIKDPAAHAEAHGLGLSDGAFFGHAGWLRLNFGCPTAVLEQGLERLIAAHRAAMMAQAGTE